MKREEHYDLEEGIRAATEAMRASMWSSLPGVVKAVDLGKQTASIQPSIQGTVTLPGGKTKNVDLPLLVDVPLVWPRAGGFALTFPVAPGDEVLVIFASRCIDSWWSSGGFANVPAEARLHDLADGFAVLAPTSQPKKLAAVSTANVQLRNEAGDTLIEITPDGKVNVTATSDVTVTSGGDIKAYCNSADVQALNTVAVTAPIVTVVGDQIGIQASTVITLDAPSILANGTPIP